MGSISKIHIVKKDTVIQDYRYGGLRMIDFSKFITALKSRWIRRILHSNSKWVPLVETIIHCKADYLWNRGSLFGFDYNKSFLERGFLMLDSG